MGQVRLDCNTQQYEPEKVWADWAVTLFLPEQEVHEVNLGQAPTSMCKICHREETG